MTGRATARRAAIIRLETPGCRPAAGWRVNVKSSSGWKCWCWQ